jgi:acetyl coenzyme A synthetase (ADP forming)-like protein
MSTADLAVFFRPNGVAVIGASRDQQKLGHGVIRNLQSVHYAGPIYPVNPREDEILGYPVYPSIATVPDPVDLAVISVPAPQVAAELEACGKRGIGGAIIISGGFRETGPAGAVREREIRRIATEYGIRVLGPNCIGTIDAHTPLNTTFVVGMPQPGEIAFVSQSGAMVAAVMDWAVGSGVGFSRIVSLGNQVDVSVAELLDGIGHDGRTRVITGYVEGIEDGSAFIAAAARVARDLPVVFIKAGRGSSGAKAVASHTGALAGDLVAYQAAFRRAGVLWANTMEEMVDWGRALAWQPLPQGNRVAILTNAGGPAILAADAIEAAGMRLAPLTPATKAVLRRRVAAAASVENPVDILAGSGPATYALCLDALLDDETVDAVVVIQAPQDWFKPVSLAEVVGEVAHSPLGCRKPILTVIMGLASTSEAMQILHRRRIPNYAFPERVGSTLAAMWWRKRWLAAQETASTPAPLGHIDVVQAHSIIERYRALCETDMGTGQSCPPASAWLAPDTVAALLAAYGIAVPGSGLAADVEDACALAAQVGYPVALKLAATGVTHKTDVGGVALHIETPEQLRREFAALLARVKERAPELLVQGVTVQHMVAAGAELIVGVVRDAQFGLLVMAGLGGTSVELQRAVAFELAPLSAGQAADLLDRTAAGTLLAGFRGAPPADRAAAVDAIRRLAQLARDCPAIQEIEINPLIVGEQGAGVIAVDARVRVASRLSPPTTIPPLDLVPPANGR